VVRVFARRTSEAIAHANFSFNYLTANIEHRAESLKMIVQLSHPTVLPRAPQLVDKLLSRPDRPRVRRQFSQHNVFLST
jgi:hypothetical protein